MSPSPQFPIDWLQTLKCVVFVCSPQSVHLTHHTVNAVFFLYFLPTLFPHCPSYLASSIHLTRKWNLNMGLLIGISHSCKQAIFSSRLLCKHLYHSVIFWFFVICLTICLFLSSANPGILIFLSFAFYLVKPPLSTCQYPSLTTEFFPKDHSSICSSTVLHLSCIPSLDFFSSMDNSFVDGCSLQP